MLSSSLCNWCHHPTSYCAFSSKHLLLLLDTIYTLLQSICHTATRSGLIPLTLNRCSRIYSVIIVIHSSTCCCCCCCSSCLPDTTLHYLLENKTTVALDGHTPYHPPPPPPVIFSPSLEPKASSLDFPEPTTILNK